MVNLAKSLLKSYEKRESLWGDESNNAFRLLNGRGDGVHGLSLDVYGEYLLAQIFDKSLMDEKESLLKEVVNSLKDLPVNFKGIFLKDRVKYREASNLSDLRKSVLIEGSEPPEGFFIKHNGIKMLVDIINGQSTGVFLDMRTVRENLKNHYSEMKSMLNLFSYTGMFSLHGLTNGLSSAVNVDLSKPVLKRSIKNYEVNGLPVDERDFVYGSSFQWIKRFQKNNKEFSLVVFDPPTFSRNKKETFSIARDYAGYLKEIARLAPGGFVLSAVNTFTITEKEYFGFHPENWERVFYENESSDFRVEGDPYLKVGLWKVNSK